MKALKSQLTKEILSDPEGKRQLRTYLASKKDWTKSSSHSAAGAFIDVHSKKGTYRVKPIVVSKAV